jgi:YegS/Rv2252/BmrU family lipid kinase
MRIGIIINPGAGRRDARGLLYRVEALAARSGTELVTRVCSRLERIESIAHSLATEVDMIGVLGGDGSLNGAVNGIMRSEHPGVPVFFVPAGRGMDAARTLPSWDLKRLNQRSMNHRLVNVDLGLVETRAGKRYFINESSIGTGAFAARSASQLPRMLGTASYLIGTLHSLAHERPFTAMLEIDVVGYVELPRCHHITVANGRYFGGGLQIAPHANPSDGLLDIVAVADAGAVEIARALPRLFRATHLTHRAVHHWQATGVSVQTDTPALLESDGEQWTTTPAHFSVMKHALTWVEPQ